MGVPDAIDQVVTNVHDNRTGLSYGYLAWGLIGAIGTRGDHRLNHVEAWSIEHRHALEAAMGVVVGDKDFTDDRLADLLWVLGDPEGQPARPSRTGWANSSCEPTGCRRRSGGPTRPRSASIMPETPWRACWRSARARIIDPTYGSLWKPWAPWIRQGCPWRLYSTLPGNHADDLIYIYWPLWQRMARLIGHPNWLFVGDSKLHSAENLARIHRARGWFLTPLPMKGTIPEEFTAWLQHAPRRLTPIRLPDAQGHWRVVGHGFEVERRVTWTDPDTGEVVTVPERVFMVRRTTFKQHQITNLLQRLECAERALKAKHGQRAKDPTAFEAEVQAILEQHKAADFLHVKVTWKIERETKWLGRGRPGPQRPQQVIEHHRARVSVRRRAKAIEVFERQAGWRAYGTNAPPSRLTLQQAVEKYAGQWQPERGFHRIKGGGVEGGPDLPADGSAYSRLAAARDHGIAPADPDRVRGAAQPGG